MEKRLNTVEKKTNKLEVSMAGVKKDIEHNTEMLDMTREEVKEGFASIRDDLNNGIIEKITETIKENMPREITVKNGLAVSDKIWVALIMTAGLVAVEVIKLIFRGG